MRSWLRRTSGTALAVSADGTTAVGSAADTATINGNDMVSPGWELNRAYDVSGDGSIVVGSSGINQDSEAFRWENGTTIGLGDLPGGSLQSLAFDISTDGSVGFLDH